jgi:predicted acyltransferase
VLLTAGVACTSLAAIAWLVDAKGPTRWTQPLVVFGVNPLMAYVGAELTAILFDSTIKFRIDGRMRSLHESAYEHLFVPWMDARLASLAYSLVFVALCYVLLLALYRRRIFAKI